MKSPRPLISIKIIAPLIFGLSILVYTYFKTENLLLGPTISLTAPADGASVTEPLVELRGRARRIASLFLNGDKIFTDENGYFKEKLLLAEGHNIIKLEAADKFGRQTEKFLSLVYTPLNHAEENQRGTAEWPEAGGDNQND
jgi:hypothetical protein